MNKKGFTLVELLAVIAILAILVVMLVPNVIDTLNSSKENTFITQAQTILKTAQEDWILNGNGSSKVYCLTSGGTSSTVLSFNGKTMYYLVIIDSTGKVTKLQVDDGTKSVTKTGTNINIADITAVDGTYSKLTSCK